MDRAPAQHSAQQVVDVTQLWLIDSHKQRADKVWTVLQDPSTTDGGWADVKNGRRISMKVSQLTMGGESKLK